MEWDEQLRKDPRANWQMLVTEEQRAEVDRRAEIVQLWHHAKLLGREHGRREREVTPAFIDFIGQVAGTPLTRGTLYNWGRALAADGLYGLVDQRWLRRPKEAPERCGAFLAELARLYTEPGLRSIEHCHLEAQERASAKGWRSCTLRESRRFIRQRVLPGLTREPGVGRG